MSRPFGYKWTPEQREKIQRAWDDSEKRYKAGTNRGKKFSPEHREKMRQYSLNRSEAHLIALSTAQTGKKFSEKDKEKMAVSAAKRRGSQRSSCTNIHKKLYNFLSNAGFYVKWEVPFGRASVDCYLPDYHIAFEADGSYWHNRPGEKEKDRIRDDKLLREFDLPVVRFWDYEIENF